MSSQLPEPSEQLLLPMNPTHFQEELNGYGTVSSYVVELIAKYQQAEPTSATNLRKFAARMSLPESNASQAEIYVQKQLYCIGGLIGLRVIELERGTIFMSGLYDDHDHIAMPDLSSLEDQAEKHHSLAQWVMEMSDRGYSLAPPYHEAVEGIAGQLCAAETDNEPYVRRGFGLTMFMAGLVVKRNIELDALADLGLMEFEAAKAVGGNWDAALAELTGGGR